MMNHIKTAIIAIMVCLWVYLCFSIAIDHAIPARDFSGAVWAFMFGLLPVVFWIATVVEDIKYKRECYEKRIATLEAALDKLSK